MPSHDVPMRFLIIDIRFLILNFTGSNIQLGQEACKIFQRYFWFEAASKV